MKITPASVEKRISELKKQAVKIAQDRANLLAMVHAAREKASKQGVKFKQDLLLILDLLKEYGQRRYKETSWKSIVLASAAIIYFLNPFDMIPDFLVGGLFDDGVVLSWVILVIADEIENFRIWNTRKKSTKKKKPKKKAKAKVKRKKKTR